MVNKIDSIVGVAALALVFGAGTAFAQYGGAGSTGQQRRQPSSTTNQGNSQTATANTKSSGDETFAKKAAAGGMAEVKLGQRAEERASNPAVKNFGRRMLQDHSKPNNKPKPVTSNETI